MVDLFCTWNWSPVVYRKKATLGHFQNIQFKEKVFAKKLSIKQELTTSVSKIIMIVLSLFLVLTTYLFTMNTFCNDNLFVKCFVISRKK